MKDDVVTTGKSQAQVAADMAERILLSMENKSWKQVKRAEYLKTVAQCVEALRGVESS